MQLLLLLPASASVIVLSSLKVVAIGHAGRAGAENGRDTAQIRTAVAEEPENGKISYHTGKGPSSCTCRGMSSDEHCMMHW